MSIVFIFVAVVTVVVSFSIGCYLSPSDIGTTAATTSTAAATQQQ